MRRGQIRHSGRRRVQACAPQGARRGWHRLACDGEHGCPRVQSLEPQRQVRRPELAPHLRAREHPQKFTRAIAAAAAAATTTRVRGRQSRRRDCLTHLHSAAPQRRRQECAQVGEEEGRHHRREEQSARRAAARSCSVPTAVLFSKGSVGVVRRSMIPLLLKRPPPLLLLRRGTT